MKKKGTEETDHNDASVEVERARLIAIGFVMLLISIFSRNLRSKIPSDFSERLSVSIAKLAGLLRKSHIHLTLI